MLLVFVLLVAGSLFAVRGPMKAASRSGDLYLIYAASRTWLVGENPYDETAQRRVVYEANEKELPRRDRELISLYPPATFVIMSPFVLGSFDTTLALWLGVNMISLALLIVGAARLGEIDLGSRRAAGWSRRCWVWGRWPRAFGWGR